MSSPDEEIAEQVFAGCGQLIVVAVIVLIAAVASVTAVLYFA